LGVGVGYSVCGRRMGRRMRRRDGMIVLRVFVELEKCWLSRVGMNRGRWHST